MSEQPGASAALKQAATTGTALDKKDGNPIIAALAKANNAMKAVLPKHLTPEKMSRLALSVLRTNRTLAATAQGNPESFVAAVMTAGQLGLEIGIFGEAHLVPFGSEIACIPGYQGLMKLARNSRMVVDIYAHEVRKNDKFEMAYGLQRGLKHEPLTTAQATAAPGSAPTSGGFPASDEQRGDIVGFYAVAELANGSRTFFAVSLAEAHKTRDASRGYQAAKKYKKDHPWDTHFEAMGRKTAIRRLCNTLPKSPELAAALAIDNAHDRGVTAAIDADFTVLAQDDDLRVDTGGEDSERKREEKKREDAVDAGTQAKDTGKTPTPTPTPAPTPTGGKVVDAEFHDPVVDKDNAVGRSLVIEGGEVIGRCHPGDVALGDELDHDGKKWRVIEFTDKAIVVKPAAAGPVQNPKPAGKGAAKPKPRTTMFDE